MVIPRTSAGKKKFGGTHHHKMCTWVLLIHMDFGRKFLSCNLNGRASLQHFLSLACCGAASDPAAMEEEWSDPETQDTEFKVHPPFIIGSCNIYSRVSWELDFRWEISPYHTFIYNTDMHFHTCIYVNISYKYTQCIHIIYIYICVYDRYGSFQVCTTKYITWCMLYA